VQNVGLRGSAKGSRLHVKRLQTAEDKSRVVDFERRFEKSMTKSIVKRRCDERFSVEGLICSQPTQNVFMTLEQI